MRGIVRGGMFVALLATGGGVATPAVGQRPPVLAGTVLDSLTGRPVPFVVVSVAGTSRSTLTDRQGRYRLDLPAGQAEIEFRKIGYRMTSRPVTVSGDRDGFDAVMIPLPVALADIRVTAEWVNPAHRIIREAIARKRDLLDRIHDYQYHAYVKFIIRDLGKSRDSTDSVILITETRTTAFWEQPDTYQETITARRQSSNLNADDNLVSVGEIVNFNRDRIDLQKYSVVSPTADDALDHYDYHILDTLEVDGRSVIRLAIEPRRASAPLFVGMIDIIDSTFEVRAIDVGANEAIRYDFVSNLRYQQRLGEVQPGYWMPTQISFSGELSLGVPLPGFPQHMSFTHLATLEDFAFDGGNAPATLGEYLMVVDENADDRDSTFWETERPAPLSELERGAFTRIDSMQNRPSSVGARMGQGLLLALAMTGNEDLFHFNRAEGAYLGLGTTLRNLSPDLTVRLKSGYAFGLEEWQHAYGVSYRLHERQRVWLSASYRDEVRSRPSIVSGGRNSSILAVTTRLDPLDYYHESGWSAAIATKVTNFTQLRLQYNDVRNRSLGVVTDYALFDPDRPQRSNPAVAEGRLRSLSGSFSLDSRPRLKRKGRDFLFNTIVQTQLTLGAEYASPSFIATDFDFFRVFLLLSRRQRTFNLGLTDVTVFAGTSSGDLPPQRYFTVDFGLEVFYQAGGFNTLNEQNFAGNRALMLSVNHDFDQQLFRRSRIPLIRDLPFTASVHGGVFWTEFHNHAPQPGDALMQVASDPYGELGFGIGNLTPFIAPFNFAVSFTWQLSSYPTSGFRFQLGIPAPR